MAVLVAGAAGALGLACVSACSRGPLERPAGSSIAGNRTTGTAPPPLNVLTRDTSDGNLLGSSRAVTVRLDLATRVATLVRSDKQPEGQVAQVMGNAQTTPGGDLFVGWGALPYISEFSPSGKLLFNAKLPPGVSTYRAYLLPWHPAS